MTSIEFHARSRNQRSHAAAALTEALLGFARRTASSIRNWNRQRVDRAAFKNLLEKEEWVYRDMGIHRGDVEWAARLPLHINASQELEKLRARSMMGR